MATTYAYLVDPNKQYMTKSGTINVNGTLRVYDAATDDIVITYKDFNGTENEASITLDNNGRAIVITDSARAYRLEVYDRYGSLQWTVSPLWCLAAGGGVNVHTTRVISTDGSIDVDQIDVGSTTTYDIGLAPSDSMEYLEWVKCNDENISNGTWYPTYAEGTMETSAGEGLQVGESRFYHITSTLKVDPTGNGINYETMSVRLMFNDGEEHELIRRDFDIDNSVNDPTLCEFSYDFACPADGFIYIKVDGVNHFTQVDSELQVHRIYSGINAVPGSCAAKPWVSEYFEEKSSMSAYIPFSGLDYNQGGRITGISGSAIYAALDSSTVSAIASSYAESAISSISGWSGDFSSISSKIDWSSSGVFQPSGDYQTAGDYAYNSSLSSKVDQSAFEQCCDEVHSAIDEKLDKSASGEFQPSGNYVYESAYSSFSSEVTNNISSISSTVSGLTGQYIEQSASSMFQPSGNYASASDLSSYVPFSEIEGEGGHVTGISGSSIKGHEYTGINPIVVDNTADTIAVEHRTLCVDSTMTAYNSGSSAVIGVNVAGLDISGKVDSSAIGTYDYYGTALVTTLSGSGFYAERANRANEDISGRPLTELAAESSLSSKQDTLTFGYDDDKISAINGSALAGQGGGGGLVTAIGTSESGITSINNSGLVDTAALHSADYSSLYVQEPLYISASGDSSYIGISGGAGDYLTAKVGSGQATFFTAFQDGMEKRPSLVISAQRSAGSSMYPRMMVTDWNDTTGDTHSGMLLANAFEFYRCPTSAKGEVDPSGFVAARLDADKYEMVVNDGVSSKTRSAYYGRSGMHLGYSGDSASWVMLSGNTSNGGFIILDNRNGVSGRINPSSIGYWNDKLDGSASSSFYTTANESGFVDSAYVESQVSSKQDTLTFDWDADSAISSINGSALAGQGGGAPIVVTGTAWDSGTSAYVYNLSSNLSAAERHVYSSQMDGQLNYIDKFFDDSSNAYRLEAALIRAGAEQCATGWSSRFVYMPGRSMWTTADDATGLFAPLQYATGACLAMSAGNYFKAYYKGNEWFVADNRYGYARGEVHKSRGSRVIVEHTGGAGAVLSAKEMAANVTLSSLYCTAKAVADSRAYVQVQRGNSNSKYNSATLDTDYLKFYAGMTTGYLDPEDTASGTAYMPAETEYMYISSIPYWNGKQDALTFAYNTANQISSIDGSSLAAGSTYSAGEGIDITDDVISVEAPVDIVAGPGIVIDNPDGNTLRVSTEADAETVLFSNQTSSTAQMSLSEAASNFEYIELYASWAYNSTQRLTAYTKIPGSTTAFNLGGVGVGSLSGTGVGYFYCVVDYSISGSTITVNKAIRALGDGSLASTTDSLKVSKIVGIHRIANN